MGFIKDTHLAFLLEDPNPDAADVDFVYTTDEPPEFKLRVYRRRGRAALAAR
jgi:hypothetical protein